MIKQAKFWYITYKIAEILIANITFHRRQDKGQKRIR